MLTRAWRLLAEDPVLEVKKLYPEVVVEEMQAAGWHISLAEVWHRREDML